MELYKYFPVANDRMGMIWTLSTIEGACIIEFGPAGTTHYAVEGLGSLNGEDKAKVYSTHMDESDVTFGKYDRLEKAIVEVDENIKPKYIFVMASSISSIIGADVKSVCRVLKKQVNAKLIPITTGGLKEDYNVGVENALKLLVKEMVKDNEQDINKYNIIGSNIDKFNFKADTEEIKRIMKELFNKEVNTVFTSDTAVENIEEASKASLNIVIRKEGLKAAKLMQEKYNIPYVYKNIYGLKNIVEFILSVKEIEGYILNENKYQEEVNLIKENLPSIKRRFYFYEKTKKCALFGDYDTVTGFKAIIEELNLEVDRIEILYKENIQEENMLSRCSEIDRMKYLKEAELLAVLGDGASLDMKHNSKLDLQISNPNLNRINLYPYTPYVGFRGLLYVMEKFINIR